MNFIINMAIQKNKREVLMNLLENEELNAKNKKSKTIMMIIIVCIILLVFLCIGIVYLMYDVKSNMTKVTINGKQIASFSEDMFLFEDDTIYISIRDFAKLVGYEVYNGDHTSEDVTKGYIQNEYEEASYTLNSNKIYKTLLSETDNEYYNLEKPIKMQNNKLYMSVEGMQIAATCVIAYDEENKQFTVYTLPYLATFYTGKFNDSAIGDEKADFSNQKALLYDMIVVKNANGKYGVRSLDNKEIIGTKYASIKFIESTKEFVVTTDDKKMGILSSTGATKIQPDYDEIKQIDKDLNYYLIKNNNKYGVINRNGNVVIHLEYDQIGIDTTQFASNNIKNQYLLFDNCIPVQRDKKWGIFDKNGKQIVPMQYDELGCISGTQSGKSNNNLLIIPEYEAIVVGVTEKDKKYGIINSLGEVLIPCVLDSIYSITSSGQDSYYMVQKENTVEVLGWLERHGFKRPQTNIENNIEDNNEANVIANETTTNSVNTVPENTMTNNNANTTKQQTTNQNTQSSAR